jgi:hypothetical protein
MEKLEGCALVEKESKLTKHQLSKNEQALAFWLGTICEELTSGTSTYLKGHGNVA